MTDAILCVDDELLILSGFQRQFRKQFNIVSALSGAHALEILATRGPFAVVMSDYNMPGMNGLVFLRKVQEFFPDSIRLMLTGKADAEAGLAAVNEGTLFRFLTKPCAPDLLAGVFTAALRQYRLVMAERGLESQILESGLGILAEVQNHLQPEVLDRIRRVETLVQRVASALKIADLGQFELAARLSHIGCLGVSHPLLQKAFTGGQLLPPEKAALRKHADIGARIVANVPDLASVAAMVRRQFEINSSFSSQQSIQAADPVLLGSQLLRLACSLDSYLLGKFTYTEALKHMSSGEEPHDPALLVALRAITKHDAAMQRRRVFLETMEIGMLTQDEFVTKSGYLLVASGVPLSETLLTDLRQHAALDDIDLLV